MDQGSFIHVSAEDLFVNVLKRLYGKFMVDDHVFTLWGVPSIHFCTKYYHWSEF